VSTAFASVLLRVCEIPNIGFHLLGNSSSGKTTCLNIAASVFGDANYVVSWKTTDNALENTAFKRNDALLILDELSEMSSSKAGDVAYMLANGKGKGAWIKTANLGKFCAGNWFFSQAERLICRRTWRRQQNLESRSKGASSEHSGKS
jgi:putative DNA primase/helicase